MKENDDKGRNYEKIGRQGTTNWSKETMVNRKVKTINRIQQGNKEENFRLGLRKYQDTRKNNVENVVRNQKINPRRNKTTRGF